jgi:predicted membrane-bound mannosyltransferase
MQTMRVQVIWALALAALALGLRWPALESRPMHTDEAVNAFIVGDWIEGRGYAYDPVDRHGPALYPPAVAAARLAGARTHADLTPAPLRRTAAWISAAVALLLALAFPAFPVRARMIAAAAWAIAPLPLYYGRYFIHESGFVLAAMGALSCGIAAWRRGTLPWALAAGAAAGLALAFKETVVVCALAGAGALLIARPERCWRGVGRAARLIAGFAAGGAGATALLFSRFGQDFASLRSLAWSATHALDRAGGQGHEKAAGYFLELLGGGAFGPWFWLAVLTGVIWALRRGADRRIRAVGAYGVLLLALHSAIPYKTPWLALGAVAPLLLLAGWGADRAFVGAARLELPWARHGLRAAIGLALAAAAGAAAWDSADLVYRRAGDPKNPLAYVHTLPGAEALAGSVRELVEAAPEPLVVAVVSEDVWPMPWVLRRIEHVGYWTAIEEVPAGVDLLVTELARPPSPNDPRWGLATMPFELRPGVWFAVWRALPPPEVGP